MIQSWINFLWISLEKFANSYIDFEQQEHPPFTITVLVMLFIGLVLVPAALFLTIILGIIDIPFWWFRK